MKPMQTKVLAPALALALAGCTPAPEAPTELSDLSRYILAEFDSDDPRVLEGALANLADVFVDVDLEGDLRDERTFVTDKLTVEDLAGIETPPGTDPQNLVPISVVGRSRHPVANHMAFQRQPDQLPAEPSAETYVRAYLAPDDPTCFGVDEDCTLLRTENDIRRVNALMRVDFVLFKDFRLVEVDEEAGLQGLAARSWLTQSWDGENGSTRLIQSYTEDIFIDLPEGGSLRYQMLQTETDLGPDVADSLVQAVVRGSIDSSFGAADDAIDELLAE